MLWLSVPIVNLNKLSKGLIINFANLTSRRQCKIASEKVLFTELLKQRSLLVQ